MAHGISVALDPHPQERWKLLYTGQGRKDLEFSDFRRSMSRVYTSELSLTTGARLGPCAAGVLPLAPDAMEPVS